MGTRHKPGPMAAPLDFPPNSEFDAVIFDCDGTLVDSMPLHHKAWRSAFKSNGASFDFDWPLFVSRAGMGMRETVFELNAQFANTLDPDQVVEDQRLAFAELQCQLAVIEPVVDFARAQFARVPLCVASGGERSVVRRSLELTGIDRLFRVVVCNEDVDEGKPSPEMFLKCAAAVGVAPLRCLVIEDGEMGIQAAQAAGMAWVRV